MFILYLVYQKDLIYLLLLCFSLVLTFGFILLVSLFFYFLFLYFLNCQFLRLGPGCLQKLLRILLIDHIMNKMGYRYCFWLLMLSLLFNFLPKLKIWPYLNYKSNTWCHELITINLYNHCNILWIILIPCHPFLQFLKYNFVLKID